MTTKQALASLLLLLPLTVSGKDLVGGEQPVMLTPEEAIQHFTLPPGYQINLFASEVNFPIHSPCAMTWDVKGRLWVANIPSHPHAKPGVPVNDSLVILEDTNKDGVADKSTKFAEGLYLPMGFELADGARTAYVVSEPNLLRLRDTNGDDVADEREIVLHGFGTEDNHHVISAFQWGPDGGLYMGQGLFLNSQVETPFGTTRMHEAGVFRYEPWSGRLDNAAEFGWSNVWGIIFDPWGKPFLADASPGLNYYMSPMMSRSNYPKPRKYEGTWQAELSFTPQGRRPSCGCEFLLSSHFPPEARNMYVTNQMKGFDGVRWYHLEESGSGYKSRQPEMELLTSTDTTFKATAMQLGPDGALYVLDYYNPIVGHTTYNFRDPRRIQTHGRVWRITHKDGKLTEWPDILGATTAKLWQILTETPEWRLRYHVRQELQRRDPAEVCAVLGLGTAATPMVEAERLWVCQGLGLDADVDAQIALLVPDSLANLSPDVEEGCQVAFRALQVELQRGRMNPRWNPLLELGVNAPGPKVQLEALIASSRHPDLKEGMRLAVQVLGHELDKGLAYAAKETLTFLSSHVEPSDKVTAFLIPFDSNEQLAARAMTPQVAGELLNRPTIAADLHRQALEFTAKELKTAPVELLVSKLNSDGAAYRTLVLGWDKKELEPHLEQIKPLISNGATPAVRETALATVARVTASPEALSSAKSEVEFLNAVPLLGRSQTSPALFPRVSQSLAKTSPRAQRLAAANAASFFPDQDVEALKLLVGIADDSAASDLPLSFAALDSMKRIPAAKWPAEFSNRILTKITITSTPDLKFEPAEFAVPAGSAVELTLFNPDNMFHNLVIVKPGELDAVGLQADFMSASPDGLKKNYVPDHPSVLHSTPQIGLRARHVIRFYAPKEAGDYPYLCSFPGHWRAMKGVMKVK